MGIDVSFFALDLGVLRDRVFPYLRGEGTLDDLDARARRLTEAENFVYRARAAALGRGVPQGGFPDWFDPDRTTWFRPFFVVGADPVEAARTVAAYQDAGPKALLDLVREQVRLLAPDRVERVRPPAEADASGVFPGRREELDELRDAYATVVACEDFVTPEEGVYEALELFDAEVYSRVLAYCACLEPVWDNRAWFFDALLEVVGHPEWMELLVPAASLFEPLFAGLPEGAFDLLSEPEWNEICGGVLLPERVPELRARIEGYFQGSPLDLTEDHENIGRALQGLLEALHHAEGRGLALTEYIH